LPAIRKAVGGGAKETGPRKGAPPHFDRARESWGALGSEPDRADGGEDADDQQQGWSDTVEVRERHFGLSSWGGGALGGGSGRRRSVKHA